MMELSISQKPKEIIIIIIMAVEISIIVIKCYHQETKDFDE